MLEQSSYNPKWKGNASKYLEAKLKILMDKRGFNITPTEREIEHLKTLRSQTEIDNAILSIIDNHWN